MVIDRKRAGIDLFDVLIVDEGQDLFEFDAISLLENSLKGGLEQGEWYIFHDVNNQAGLFICQSALKTFHLSASKSSHLV